MDLVSVTVSGEYKHYTRMSGADIYTQVNARLLPLPAHVTDSNLLVHAGGNSTQFLEEFGWKNGWTY